MINWWVMLFALTAVGAKAAVTIFELRLDPRRPSSVRTPTPDLLSPTEFAEVCASYATPAVDPEPELPDPLPPALRDPAFRERQEKLDALSSKAEDARVVMRSPESTTGQWRQAVKDEREADAQRDELYAQPLITERRFTLLTHCPKGHVAEHWIGVATGEHVSRTCRFTRCGNTWLERR